MCADQVCLSGLSFDTHTALCNSTRVLQRRSARVVLAELLLNKISFQKFTLVVRAPVLLCSPVIFSSSLYFIFISTCIVLQCVTSSSVALWEGTIAGVLLLAVKKTSYFAFVLHVRSFCPHVSAWTVDACKLSMCVYMSATETNSSILPHNESGSCFVKKGRSHCTAWCYSIMQTHYKVNYATTAGEWVV